MSDTPHIAILLGTFNGQRFLRQQLDSIAQQQDVIWTVWASDDGSEDGTLEILESYRTRWGGDKLHILQGPRRGFVKNFFSLLQRPEISGEFFAFCDQDDVWHPAKLVTAIHQIQQHPERWVLYGGRTRLISESGVSIGQSPLFIKQPCFANALVQSLMGGNTMVFNRGVKELLSQVSPSAEVVTHDWWAYQVVTGCGGVVIYDPLPMVDYRQHPENLVGMNQGLLAKLKRLKMLMLGYFKRANDANMISLSTMQDLLTASSRRVLIDFETARTSQRLFARVVALRRSKVFRQTLSGQCGLWLALMFKRL